MMHTCKDCGLAGPFAGACYQCGRGHHACRALALGDAECACPECGAGRKWRKEMEDRGIRVIGYHEAHFGPR